MKASTRAKFKKTPWYSGVNPLKSRPGWYECRMCSRLHYWSGRDWFDVTQITSGGFTWRGVQR